MRGKVSSNRDDILQRLRHKKDEIGLPLADVERADKYLRDDWGIRVTGSPERDAVIEKLPEPIRAEYDRLHELQQEFYFEEQPVPPVVDKQWYDLLAKNELSGTVISQKHPLILSGMVWISSLFNHLDVDGEILDIGCHIGYQSIWLSEYLHTKLRAIDRSEDAIAVGRENARQANVEFESWDYETDPWRDDSFEAIICCDASPNTLDEHKEFLERCSSRLAAGGLFVLIGDCMPWMITSALTTHASSLGLGFGVGDVIGGWNGDSFDAKFALALLKGGEGNFPSDLQAHCLEAWPSFQEFANTHDVPHNKKSTAYCRARG